MTELTCFINNKLKPHMWSYIPQILPHMNFVYNDRRKQWQSELHYDGTKATHPKEDKSVVTERFPNHVYDNSRRSSHSVIDLFMERSGLDPNNKSDVWEAVKLLCPIVGLSIPESSPEQIENYKKSEDKRIALEHRNWTW